MATQDLVKSLTALCQDDTTEVDKDEFLESGSIVFDAVLSNGKGFPRRKFIQLSSESGCGKSTMALHICKTLCANGYITFYLDSEKAVNDTQIESFGLKDYLNKSFFHRQLSTFEEAEEILDSILIPDDRFALIVVDSITNLYPEKVLEKSIAEIEPGLQARYMSLFLPKYKAKLKNSGCPASFLFINQMRNKINFMRGSTYEAAGGSAQKFNMDIRLLMTLKTKLKKMVSTITGREETPYGAINTIYSEKNRYNRPFVKAEIAIYFGKGISNISYYSTFLINEGYVKAHKMGMYDVQLPSMKEPVKVRGQVKLSALVRDNLDEVKQLFNAKGGVKLVVDEDDE